MQKLLFDLEMKYRPSTDDLQLSNEASAALLWYENKVT